MNFATFDLNLMRVLDALLREQSTVKAAQKLNLSQSAVSSALSRLRHTLDDQLFIRRGNRLVPTDYAQKIALPLREEMDRLEALFAQPKSFDPAAEHVDFRIAASDFFAELLMPILANDMASAAPNIQPKLIDLVPHRYVQTVEQGSSDLALIPDEPVGNWAEKEFLFHSAFAVIARRNHPALQKANIKAGEMMPLDLFCGLRHALFSPEGNSSAMGDAALAKLGRTRKVGMTLQVFSGVCRVVSESDMIALIPWQLGQKWADQMQLDIFVPPMHVPVVKIVGVWHKRSTNNPAHRWVREQIFDEMKKLDAIQPDLSAWPQARQ
ncbi:LysR family transcriptional regulator [Maritalea sp. S77]|uniref:LysR family transcriptional regulator n=1 Tax=Maritalea sp. S77 TaxID=3415125 RepID=UPI003C7A82B3